MRCAASVTVRRPKASFAHIEKSTPSRTWRTTPTPSRAGGKKHPSGLKPEHLAVFDCAFKPYRGKRKHPLPGAPEMMAAAQPFITARFQDRQTCRANAPSRKFRETTFSVEMGLKCVAIYRDGSKSSQPLNTKRPMTAAGKASCATFPPWKPLKELETEVARLRTENGKPLRRRLTDTAHRRHAQIRHRRPRRLHDGGLFEDGQPGEFHHDGQGGSTSAV